MMRNPLNALLSTAGRLKATILSRFVLALMALAALGLPAPAWAGPVTVKISAPTIGLKVDDPLSIKAILTSNLEITNATAEVEGRIVPLVFSTSGYWTNSISMAGLPRGSHTVVVSATDHGGTTGQASAQFVYDQRPVLTVSSPLKFSVARPDIHVVASCTDDDPVGCTIKVSIQSQGGDQLQLLGTGTNSFDQTLSLAALEGRPMDLLIEARDSAGQRSSNVVTLRIFVESSPRLVEVETLPGAIWQATTNRILYAEDLGDRRTLKIRDRATKADTVVMDIAGDYPSYGFLSPKGAIFVEQAGSSTSARIFDFSDGQLVDLTSPKLLTSSLVAKGSHAIWHDTSALVERDLESGINRTISVVAHNDDNDVSTNGDVVYSTYDNKVWRDSAGSVEQLSPDDASQYGGVVADGVSALFQKQLGGLILYGGTNQVEILPVGTRFIYPGSDFQLNNGWIAYNGYGTGGILQLFERSPLGVAQRITYFGTSSHLSALAPDGQIAFTVGNNDRYLGGADRPSDKIGSSLGTVFWQEGKWYIALGRVLFEVIPPPPVVLGVARTVGSKLSLVLKGQANTTYQYDTSSDLITWTTGPDGTTDGTGQLTLEVTPSDAAPFLYYRAHLK